MAVIRKPHRLPRTYGRKYELDLAALEVGDRVYTVARSLGRSSAIPYVVVRKTPTQVVAEATQHGRTWEARWRITDGKKLGESYGPPLLPADDDEVLNVQQADVVARLKDQVTRILTAQITMKTGFDSNTALWSRVAALAEVAELTAQAAEKLNELEAQRVKEEAK